MDQTASAAARKGSVLLFDTRAGTVEHIPFDPAAHGLAVLVIDTKVAHSLADGEYAERRASCEQATTTLGVRSLRDITIDELPAALDKLDNDVLRRRVRHVVTENDRVAQTVTHLRTGDITGIGNLLIESHRSLQHDYEVSCPELDQAVDSALAAGAIGATNDRRRIRRIRHCTGSVWKCGDRRAAGDRCLRQQGIRCARSASRAPFRRSTPRPVGMSKKGGHTTDRFARRSATRNAVPGNDRLIPQRADRPSCSRPGLAR